MIRSESTGSRKLEVVNTEKKYSLKRDALSKLAEAETPL